MSNWKEYKLGDIYEVHNGLSKGGKFFGSGYPFLSFSTVFNKWFLPAELSNLVQSTEKEQESFSIQKGDVFITRTSETAEELGMSCVALKDYPNATYNGFCKRMRQYNSNIEVDPKYVGYYLRNPNFRLRFQAFSGSMSTRASLTNEALLGLPINLPPLPTQQKIAQILSSLDDKIEMNNKINANLEQQAQALFKSCFVDFEPFGGEMPAGWRVGKLSEIGTIVGGSTPSKAKQEYYTNNGIAWITPKDLSNDKSKFISRGEIDITDEGLKNSSAVVMPKGTVLYSSRAPIGYIAIAKNDVTTNQGFKSVIPNQNIGNAYIYYFLKTNYDLIDSMASGSTFKEISGSAMKNVPVIIPDNKTVSDFQNFCNDIFNQQEVLEEENKKLSTLRDTLLPKLMSGELEVN